LEELERRRKKLQPKMRSKDSDLVDVVANDLQTIKDLKESVKAIRDTLAAQEKTHEQLPTESEGLESPFNVGGLNWHLQNRKTIQGNTIAHLHMEYEVAEVDGFKIKRQTGNLNPDANLEVLFAENLVPGS